MTNTIADAMRAMGEADVGIINGGFVRGDKTYDEGDKLTVGDVLFELPFPKPIAVVRLRGDLLALALEQHLRGCPEPNGRYPHVSSNVRMEYDPQQPPLQRICFLAVDGEQVDAQKEYSVCITEFMARGGDGIDAYTMGVPQPIRPHRVAYVVRDYLRERGASGISALEDRVRVAHKDAHQTNT